MIPVKIKSISITDIGFVIFLKGPSSEKVLPIFIGPVEAQSISMVLMKNKPKRPLTHDLMKTVLLNTGFKVEKVEITKLEKETYYAKLYLQKEGFFSRHTKKHLEVIDSRPSDAIAIALRFESPIYVDENLMEEQAIFLKQDKDFTDKFSDKGQSENIDISAEQNASQKADISKKVNEQLGIYEKMLEQAINDDRFEEAANIRDQINSLMKKQSNSSFKDN
ncbi:MAG TPA: bifunctional nuclease domain-containing protein [Spirochaetota bacterium]|nr:bifunctional nuclease domain-containing protein [Spirochaetota bacterium]